MHPKARQNPNILQVRPWLNLVISGNLVDSISYLVKKRATKGDLKSSKHNFFISLLPNKKKTSV